MKKSSPLISFVKEISQIWAVERPNQLAAALAYFSLFSFAPVMYIAVTIAEFFIQQDDVMERLVARFEEILGPEVAQLVVQMMEKVSSQPSSGSLLLSVISFVALLFAASYLFYQLQFVINRLWRVPRPEKVAPRVIIRQRLFAFLMTIGIGLLLVAGAVASVITNWLGSLAIIGRFESAYTILAFIGLETVSLALIFKILPDVKIAWRDVWIGAAVTAVLMTVGGWVIAFYLGHSSLSSALEAAGAVAVLLLGIYYISQIFLVGVIFTRVYAYRYGSLKGA